MNIDLKPIAESKVRQLVGDVCGVLVRKEDGTIMAVSEDGRVTRLGNEVMGPAAVTLDEPMTEDFKAAWQNGVPLQSPEAKWAFVGWQAARAQGGQGAEVAWCWENRGLQVTVDKSFAKELIADGETVRPLVFGDTQPQPAVPEELEQHLRRILRLHSERGVVLTSDIEHVAHLLSTLTAPAVPDGYVAVPLEIAERVVIDAESWLGCFGEPDTGDYYAAFVDVQALLSTPTTPQADGWVRCEDRLPTEADADSEGNVWFCWHGGDMRLTHYKQIQLPYHSEHHWMPTGLKRPQPPAQEG